MTSLTLVGGPPTHDPGMGGGGGVSVYIYIYIYIYMYIYIYIQMCSYPPCSATLLDPAEMGRKAARNFKSEVSGLILTRFM